MSNMSSTTSTTSTNTTTAITLISSTSSLRKLHNQRSSEMSSSRDLLKAFSSAFKYGFHVWLDDDLFRLPDSFKSGKSFLPGRPAGNVVDENEKQAGITGHGYLFDFVQQYYREHWSPHSLARESNGWLFYQNLEEKIYKLTMHCIISKFR